ncbi:GAF domain-containing protein [Agreia bicolorata]|uniref:GAF domain-containing protein n=1 Tax=Agreia bicolorata TaxID=110935 RepID=UPI0005CB1EC2|nr:GAF domain-containing protein [Agreia bicolorata]
MDVHDLPSRAGVHNAPVAAIPARLLASWQRSEDYGVSLDDPHPVFSGTYDDQSLFYECGREVLAELHSTLSSEPLGLMLTDADGLVLNRLSGDQELLRALDRVNLAPGFSYAERDAGTNGLGLALADRVPTLVRANDHYSLSLCGYTCAAAPIFDPLTGRLEGSVNFTTWSDARSELLLALAQTAAASTANLMLARSQGHRPRRAARGQVFRIEPLRQETGSGSLDRLSEVWNSALLHASDALQAGKVVAAVGERGSGRSTLLAQAERRISPGDRLFAVHAPEPHDVDAWLAFWTPELARPHTRFIICNTDELPAMAAERLHDLLAGPRGPAAGTVTLTAERFDAIPRQLSALVDAVVEVPALRNRANDILPLADHLARRARGREVEFTPAAARALSDYAWPGNVAELAAVVKDAALRSDVIDARHLPPELLSRAEHLPRIKAFERDEMVRVLSREGTSIDDAVAELGMSRATIYRKLAQYGISLPKIHA